MREREIHLSTIDWQFVIQFYEHIKKSRTKQRARRRPRVTSERHGEKEIEMTYGRD